MIKKKKESRKKGKKAGPAGPAGHLTSFRGGLFTLIEKLEEKLRENICRGREVTSISRSDAQSRVLVQVGDESGEFDFVILATPSYVAGRILRQFSGEASAILEQIPYSSLAVVCQGYPLAEIARPLDGFGFLVPHSQKLEILGSIWTSIIFPEQAPAGYALFRTMLGGAKKNELANRSERELAHLAHQNLAKILGIKTNAVYERVIIWKDAIPQYILGHRDRLGKIEAALRRSGPVYLAGNAYTGIGLNDAIKRSYAIAETIIKSRS